MGMMTYGVLMMFLGLVMLIGLVAIAIWAVIHLTGTERSGGGRDTQARQMLDQRYAKGEIDYEEYQRSEPVATCPSTQPAWS